MNNLVAVIFTYSFDNETPVFLFKTEKEALAFLKRSYIEEVRIDKEENGWDCHHFIEEDGRYAEIKNIFYDHEDITRFHLGEVYNLN